MLLGRDIAEAQMTQMAEDLHQKRTIALLSCRRKNPNYSGSLTAQNSTVLCPIVDSRSVLL